MPKKQPLYPHIPKGKNKPVIIPLSPKKVEVIQWAFNGAGDFWESEDFLQGKRFAEDKKPVIKDNQTLVVPPSDLQKGFLEDLKDRMEQYANMARDEYGNEPKGLTAIRLAGQLEDFLNDAINNL